ncbi:MAG: tetratricopeptide repeat protein [Pseudomonadota bacterium]
MKAFSKLVVMTLSMILAACANPLNQVTSDRYSESCAQAERSGRINIAEQACYRALVNVDLGNLGEVEKSQKMYNLARIKRQLQKFDEAEKLYIDSLAIEERQPQPSNERIGRRLAELAISYAQEKKYDEGAPYVERLYTSAIPYQGIERKTVAAIFYAYSQELPATAPGEVRNKLERKAVEMGFDPKTYRE